MGHRQSGSGCGSCSNTPRPRCSSASGFVVIPSSGPGTGSGPGTPTPRGRRSFHGASLGSTSASVAAAGDGSGLLAVAGTGVVQLCGSELTGGLMQPLLQMLEAKDLVAAALACRHWAQCCSLRLQEVGMGEGQWLGIMVGDDGGGGG
jgi:hypothetical protein